MRKATPKKSQEEISRDMKGLVSMLLCSHQWGEARKASVIGKNGKPKDGDWRTCQSCGTHEIRWPDGTGSLFPPDALGPKPDGAT